jgi:glycosyltransferase involved in cell wall biosynthesis
MTIPVLPAPRISALMSTYARERPQWLTEALESLFAQSVPPDELVLVIDGPVAEDQEAVIARYQHDPRIAQVKVVRLAQNGGLAHALNAGLEACTGEWIMRMDSDDRAHPDRLRIQLDYIDRHPDIDVFSTWCEEFSDDSPKRRVRSSPTEHEAVIQALRWRNIIAHPTNLIRMAALRRVDGYRAEYGMLEDYDLYVRLALSGARFHVIPAELLEYRKNDSVYVRRGGWGYLMGEIRFRLFCLRSGFLNVRQFLVITAAYSVFRLIGGPLRLSLYRLVRVPTA